MRKALIDIQKRKHKKIPPFGDIFGLHCLAFSFWSFSAICTFRHISWCFWHCVVFLCVVIHIHSNNSNLM